MTFCQLVPRRNRHRFHSRVLLPTFLAGALLASPAAVAEGPSGEVTERIAEGKKHLYAGQHRKAIREFEKADELADGQSPEALAGLAKAHYHDGTPREAVAAAERLLDLADDPKNRLLGYQLLGSAYYADRKLPDEERLAKAEEAYRDAIRLSEGRAFTPLFSLAQVLEESGREEAALELLRTLPTESLDDQVEKPFRLLLCRLKKTLPPEAGGVAGVPREDRGEVHHLPGPGEDGTAREEHEVQKPRKLHMPMAHYPEKARQRREQGTVAVQAVIDRDGCVVDVEVVRSASPSLDEATVETISGWVFSPALLDGEPVDVYYDLTTNFGLGR